MNFSQMILLLMQSFVYVAIVAIFLIIAKFVSDKLASFDADDMIEEKNNQAVAYRRAGLYLGTAIGMFGALLGGASKGFVVDVGVLILDGIMITVFMLIVRRVNDWFVVHGIDNNDAIKNHNTAVGLVEAGGYIATGIIAYASVVGTGGPWWSSVVYFGLGQAVLLFSVVLYEQITPWNVVQDVRENNVSAGLMLAGIMIAISFVLRGAIAGPFGGWMNDLTGFAISTAVGLTMVLVLFNKFIDRVFLPGTDIRTEIERDENVAAITVVVAVKIALAIIIGAVVI